MPAERRIDGVDLLRGLAILFVLMNHVNVRLSLAKVPYRTGFAGRLIGPLVWNGHSAVQMFFAVSGFLITSTALRRWGSPGSISLRGFYRLRFARIAPLLLLLLAILSALHFAGVSDYVVPAKRGGFTRAIFAALTFHVNIREALTGYLPGSWDILWSLSIEEVFYFFFPLFCRCFGRGRLLVWVLLIFVALGPLHRSVFTAENTLWQEYGYLGGMDSIALGCLTALLVRRVQLSPGVLRALAAAGAAILIFSLIFAPQAYRWVGQALGDTVLALGTCMVIVAATQSGWAGPRILRPLLRLGERSYEVYLTHMFIVFAVLHVFLYSGKRLAGVPVFFAAVILIAGAFGALVARYYSEPMNRRLRGPLIGLVPGLVTR